MNRKQFLKLSGLAGAGGVLQGCQGLAELEKMPEGTGVQIVGSVVFLAKYRATATQQAQARQKGAQVYISKGLKPAAQAKLKAIKSPATARDAPPEKRAADMKLVEAERTAVKASYYSEVRKRTGGRVPGSLKLDSGPVAEIPPDPKVTKDLLAASKRSRSMKNKIAVQVASSGQPAERQNPGAVTVMVYDTKASNLVADTAYVLPKAPRAGEQIKLDGVSASFVN